MGTNFYTPEAVKALLDNDPEFLGRALLTLAGEQTDDEMEAIMTKHNNKAGFNAADGTFLTGVAVRLISLRDSGQDSFDVPPELVQETRDRLKKYSKQLSELIDDTFWEDG